MNKVIAINNKGDQIVTSIETADKNKWWITYSVEATIEKEEKVKEETFNHPPKPGMIIAGASSHLYKIVKAEPIHQCCMCYKKGSHRIINKFYCEPHFDKLVITKPVVRDHEKPQRNKPCPCGSGKKYKACCAKGKKKHHYFNSEYNKSLIKK